ncbi:HAD family hydrolase [Marinilactibacillus sp. GCM10026970]|uniref:HAD family hydrolase n=1 Tax=Marinilactibacillus sp. GCM10026970 TaxID=3252642 RepID=UPI0036229E0B
MIKGILFDKDGTLVEFSETWELGTIDFLKNAFELDEQASDRTLKQIGFVNGELVPNSPIASGTSIDIAEVISLENKMDQEDILKQLREHYHKWTIAHPEALIPLTNLKALFQELKSAGIKIGIATADDLDVTEWTAQYLGVREDIDFLGTSEQFRAKPDVEMLDAFCMSTGLKKNEVIHIGDSVADMEFSKHCYAGIAVLSGAGTRAELSEYTDYIVDSLDDLIPLLRETFKMGR